MTEPLLTSAAPVFEVDGAVVGEPARDLLQLEVEETTGGLKRCTARLLAQGPLPGRSDEGLLYLDGSIFDFGRTLAVSIGPDHLARKVFEGVVSGFEADIREAEEPEVVIFAEDRLMQFRMTRRIRTYRDMSDADMAEEIAGLHGLEARVDADGPAYDVVQQWNQSDLAFLRDRAARIQAELWFEDGALHFQTRERRPGTDLTLVQGNQIISLRARADLAHQRSEVRVSGFDAAQRSGVAEVAGEDVVSAEAAGGRNGVSVLRLALGERPTYRVRDVALNDGEAQAWARAEMLRRSRRFVMVTATTRGTPDLAVASRVTIQGAGAAFDGPGYYVTRACHRYDLTNGYRTDFEAERATIQEAA